MEALRQPSSKERYRIITEEKASGAVYTPKILADFVAKKIVESAGNLPNGQSLFILDPAVGHGELLVSLLDQLIDQPKLKIEIHGFETDSKALDVARERLRLKKPDVSLKFSSGSFLDYVLEQFEVGNNGRSIFSSFTEVYDLIIANPPYVRTQILGSEQAQLIARRFGLSGRVDLYYAFILGIAKVLKPKGVGGIIVSNRFMTTRSGAKIRQNLLEQLCIQHIWDLGDTKLFKAAVLPAVLIFEHRNDHRETNPSFTTIYQTSKPATGKATDPISALDNTGVIKIEDGRNFHVQHGKLNTNGESDGIWRIATKAVDKWLATVDSHSWGTFRDIGKIRVGVKTCADKIFIRNDWQDMPASTQPELLKPITTHHIARRYKPQTSESPKQILYTHEIVDGCRRAIELIHYPKSQAYLEAHRADLEGRLYVIKAGRKWYEIWVPQDPDAWCQEKLVFRDIAEEPTFWIDLNGSVVNGDCYWLTSVQTNLLWLAAAVGNSTFIKRFYDLRFHNKLYAGRRRFVTQYVEKFPLPDPYSSISKSMIALARQIYDLTPSPMVGQLHKELDALVWKALTGELRH